MELTLLVVPFNGDGARLQGLLGLVLIDEVQRRPDLFQILRVLVDRSPNPSRSWRDALDLHPEDVS